MSFLFCTGRHLFRSFMCICVGDVMRKECLLKTTMKAIKADHLLCLNSPNMSQQSLYCTRSFGSSQSSHNASVVLVRRPLFILHCACLLCTSSPSFSNSKNTTEHFCIFQFLKSNVATANAAGRSVTSNKRLTCFTCTVDFII